MNQDTELGNKHEISVLMDKLTIRLLELIEEHIQCKINIEKRTNEGNLLLAKTRYIQGANSVTINQLPTENTPEFNALVNVEEVKSDNLHGKKFVVKKFSIDKEANRVDPMKWFGVLVPRSLQFARERYQMSTELVVESVNIQRELEYVMCCLSKLRAFKNTWKDSGTGNVNNLADEFKNAKIDTLNDTKEDNLSSTVHANSE